MKGVRDLNSKSNKSTLYINKWSNISSFTDRSGYYKSSLICSRLLATPVVKLNLCPSFVAGGWLFLIRVHCFMYCSRLRKLLACRVSIPETNLKLDCKQPFSLRAIKKYDRAGETLVFLNVLFSGRAVQDNNKKFYGIIGVLCKCVFYENSINVKMLDILCL